MAARAVSPASVGMGVGFSGAVVWLREGGVVGSADEEGKMKRLISWFRKPPVNPPAKPLVPEVVSAYRTGYADGHLVGFAQGELKGRLDLANELEAQYGVDAREDLSQDAVKRVRARQVH